MIEAHLIHAQQTGRDRRQALSKDKHFDDLVGTPQVRDLEKRFVIGIAFLQRQRLRVAPRDFAGDFAPVSFQQFGAEDFFQPNESVSLVHRDDVVRKRRGRGV